MTHKFDDPAKGLAQSLTFRLATAGSCAWGDNQISGPARANDFRVGPVSDLSDPDVFAGCGP
jgi:hypothetical protein